MKTGEWQCRYCGLRTALSSEHVEETISTVRADNQQGPCTFRLLLTVCPNRDCKALTATLGMYKLSADASGTLRIQSEPGRVWKLIPASNAKGMPDYVPERIAKEYNEACSVLEVSPNAAATLARRCLQAIIRDFFGVKKNSLADEIDAIKDKLDPEIWEAVDAARKTGMVGKNMEKGVNLVFDAEPDEPQILIGLIEYFVQECYVARHQRKQRLEEMRGRTSLKPSH
jgi:hypothetical protein